ncbi:DUF2913 family protein [Pantoea dispersa]|uniref:DUF2913 family protein n=1 Tax=Pantoea dispersa TaxID=59814 RepID=UPI001CA640C2|nr:DUF2913 family protein [Pantoea dispersa]QZY97830.1 DUF2913 family protein [Pantoea dispersa]
MDNDNLNVSHLAWCGLIALHTARRDGQVSAPAQENLFLTRWLATAEKQRRFPRALAPDIRWLLSEGRSKGVHADLPGKLQYLWESASGDVARMPDLVRLRHVVSAVKLAGWIYRTLSDSEWHGRKALHLNPGVWGLYVNLTGLEQGFDEGGRQTRPLPARITGDLAALDKLLSRSGWRREPAAGADPLLHHLLAEDARGA